ncbi:MAG: sulfatase-like hydrolase/transferase, partial [Gammaproteobacteria bacterium]|nr:sulfatase-like hydrolase/transferase [Gammaproteobacteria bacterium]
MFTRQTLINWLRTACGSTVSLPPPPCSPLRHALYTGLYPIRSGAYPNHTMVDPETRSVFHHLKGLGYRVGLLGKTHISPAVAFPFENISSRTDEIDEAAAFFNRDEQQPWFMVFASNEPHAPWRSGPRERYDANKLTLPSWLHDNQITRNALADYYAEI